jgi:hypothetical protein
MGVWLILSGSYLQNAGGIGISNSIITGENDIWRVGEGAWTAAVVMVTSFSDGDATVEKSAGGSVVDDSPSCMAELSSGRFSIIVLSDDKVSLLCGAHLGGK